VILFENVAQDGGDKHRWRDFVGSFLVLVLVGFEVRISI
jgi:hypothetical protein